MNISVIIPTYNRPHFLKRALKSVLSQTYKPKEIIVVNDGGENNELAQQLRGWDFSSTDKPQNSGLQVELQFSLINKPNGGVASARNEGIKASSCEWVAFLDDDDTWDENKLALQVEFLKKHKDILFSYTNEKWIFNSHEKQLPKKYAKYGGDIFERCLSHCIIAPSSVMMHKSIFKKVGFFDESLEVCEDYDLWLRITVSERVGLIDKKLITKYAGHEGQLSFKHWGMDRFRIRALQNLQVKDENQKRLVKDMLTCKLNLLIKGARKHGREKEVKEYENILLDY